MFSLRAGGVVASLSVFLCSTSVRAETSASEGAGLDEVTVTATRTPNTIGDTLASVTVLNQQDIELRQVLSLQDLFVGLPGLQVSNNGGLGKATSVFVRGANADQILVLVDGVRMGSATIGTTSFQYLPVDQFGRVEIVRGPMSSLYGSEAMGGVIQLFTQRPTTDGLNVQADASYGSHATSSYGGRADVVSGGLTFGLSGNNLASNGYADCTGAPPTATFGGAGCFVNDARPDGYHSASSSAHLGYRLNDTSDIEATFMRSEGGTRYAGDYTDHESFVEQEASVAGHWSPVAALRITAQIGRSHDNELDTLDGVEPPGNLLDTTRNTASIQADWTIVAKQIVTLGTDYLKDSIADDADFPVTSRRISGVFGEYQGTFGPQQLAISLRHDDNTQYGDKTTGSAAWGYRFADTLRVTASYGTAFQAPSFDDLYYPYYGNPLLRPETSHSVEVGVDQQLPSAHWSLRAYDTDYHNLISYDAAFFAPENTDEARIRGLEAQAGLVFGLWTADATATLLDARNRTAGSAEYDDQLPRRARSTGMLEVARRFEHVRLAARYDVSGPSYDDAANSERLGGWSTVDTLAEWTPTTHWALQAKVANVTGHRYQTALYYPQDGRNFLVTVRYRPASF
jgi:vitamin B12 transporter